MSDVTYVKCDDERLRCGTFGAILHIQCWARSNFCDGNDVSSGVGGGDGLRDFRRGGVSEGLCFSCAFC